MKYFYLARIGLALGLAGCASDKPVLQAISRVDEEKREFYDKYDFVKERHLQTKPLYPSKSDCDLIEHLLESVHTSSNPHFNYKTYLLNELEEIILKYRRRFEDDRQEKAKKTIRI